MIKQSENGRLMRAAKKRKYDLKKTKVYLYTPGIIDKQMQEAGFDTAQAKKYVKMRSAFEIWLKHINDPKVLTEIQRLDQLIQILEMDMTTRTMKKLSKGIPLSPNDIKLIKELRECFATIDKMKYGEKHFNVNASIKDIRKLMFPEEGDENVRLRQDMDRSGRGTRKGEENGENREDNTNTQKS